MTVAEETAAVVPGGARRLLRATTATWFARRAIVVFGLGAVYVVGSLACWHDTQAGVYVGDGFLVVAPLVGAGIAFAGAWRGRGRGRVFVALAGAAVLSWGIGQIVYAYFDLIAKVTPPFPGPPDWFYVPAALFLVAAVSVAPATNARTVTRARWIMDGLLLVAPMLAWSWLVVLGPLYRDTSGGDLQRGLAVFYPICDLVAATVTIASMRRRADNAGMLVFLLGVASFTVGDSVYSVLNVHALYSTGLWIDPSWACGSLLIGLGAREFVRRSGNGAPASTPGWVPAIGPYLLVGSLAPGVMWVQLSGRPGQEFELITAVALVVLLARQALVLRDNEGLASALRQSEEHFRHRALHDPLTGLANRDAFYRHGAALAATSGAALLLIDLDRFKAVNDTRGHDTGDELLGLVARRLAEGVRDGDLVARLGGDEFTVLLARSVGMREAQAAAERLIAVLREPYALTGGPARISASVGIDAVPVGGQIQDSLRNADLALYRAKALGGTCAVVFADDLLETVQRQEQLRSGLETALEDGQLVCYFQPIFDVAAERVVGYEALARWLHPELGVIPPAEFMPMLESTDLIGRAGELILRSACASVAEHNRTHQPVELCVNVSARQLGGDELVEAVVEALRESGLPAGLLTLELTESALLEDIDDAARALSRVVDLGVNVAVDDFGTGYSSLSYLARLPVQTVKIDRSFTQDADQRRTRALMHAIVDFSHRLGLTVVAEGVETQAQLEAVRSMSADRAQGFLLGRPAPTLGDPPADPSTRPPRAAGAQLSGAPAV